MHKFETIYSRSSIYSSALNQMDMRMFEKFSTEFKKSAEKDIDYNEKYFDGFMENYRYDVAERLETCTNKPLKSLLRVIYDSYNEE